MSQILDLSGKAHAAALEEPFITDDIKLHLRDELTPARNRGFYICPLCGSGAHNTSDSDGAVNISKDGKLWNCHSCGEGGDIVTLIEKRDGLSKAEARQYLLDKYAGLPPRPYAATRDATTAAPQDPEDTQQGPTEEWQANAWKYMPAAAEHFKGSPAEAYMINRGITAETCKRFNIGYDPEVNRGSGAVVIPYPGKCYYIQRPFKPYGSNKYLKPKGVDAGPQPAFIAGDLSAPYQRIAYICEGQIDALSLWQAGAAVAIATGGTSTGCLDAIQLPDLLIIVADNDDPGIQFAEKISTYVEQRGALAYIVHPPKEDKDVNDTLRRDPALLPELVDAWAGAILQVFAEIDDTTKNDRVEGPYSPANEKDDNLPVEEAKAPKTATERARDRIADFLEHIQTERYKPHATGLSFFDDLLSGGIINQTILQIMAEPGTGKTTLCMQLAEEMTARGTPVLYLNLEMSADQMIAKAISYRLSKAGTPTTATRILQGYSWTDEERAQILQEVTTYATLPQPVEYYPDPSTDIDRILSHLDAVGSEAKAAGQQAPVVILDYLHLITSGATREDVQQLLKRATAGLKQYAIKHDTCVIYIAAINRSSNAGETTLASARDSSTLEYTADYVIALDYDQPDNPAKLPAREIRDALQREDYRRVVLRLFKNRHGLGQKDVNVYYYAAGNIFYAEKDPAIKGNTQLRPFGSQVFVPANNSPFDDAKTKRY